MVYGPSSIVDDLDRQHPHHLFMHQLVAGENRRLVNAERRAIVVRNPAAGFFDHQYAGSHVPGFQSFFPKTIKPAASHISEIERGGSVATDRLSIHDEVGEVA